jgi:hypothetical protein
MTDKRGRNLAHQAPTKFLDEDPRGCLFIALASGSGNGERALVAARDCRIGGRIQAPP